MKIQHNKPYDDFIKSCCDFMHNTLTVYAVSRIRRNFRLKFAVKPLANFLNTFPQASCPQMNINGTKRTLLNR